MVFDPEYAARIVNAVVTLIPMWGVALSVLGIHIVKRSGRWREAAGGGDWGGGAAADDTVIDPALQ
jgi:hypothetical protein